MAEQNRTQQASPTDGGMGQRAKRYLIEETRSLAEERGFNERAAARVASYRDAVGAVRERISGGGPSRAAGYLEDVTISADKITESLRIGDWRTARAETRRVAQEHPEILLGTAFMAGAFIGRILRENLAEREQAPTRQVPTPPRDAASMGTATTDTSLKGV